MKAAMLMALVNVVQANVLHRQSAEDEPFSVSNNLFANSFLFDEVVTQTFSDEAFEKDVQANAERLPLPDLIITSTAPATEGGYNADKIEEVATTAPTESSPAANETDAAVESSGYGSTSSSESSTNQSVETEHVTEGSASSEEVPNLESLAVQKVSGETSNENPEASTSIHPEADVGSNGAEATTSLEIIDGPPTESTQTVEAELETISRTSPYNSNKETDSPENTEIVNIPKKGCPQPRLCAKNCFVAINDEGCQDCQCLWQSVACDTDADCPDDNQLCDLSRCNCKPGFRQDMRHSSVCEKDQNAENASSQSLGVEAAGKFETTSTSSTGDAKDPLKKAQSSQYRYLRKKRSAEKPRSAERLEWPGSCDSNEECPDSLYCIEGDCWSIPEKTSSEERSSEQPSSFVISRNAVSDHIESEEEAIESTKLEAATTTTTFPTLIQRGMTRFVPKADEYLAEKLKIQRTTEKFRDFDWISETVPTSSETTPTAIDQFFVIQTTSPRLPHRSSPPTSTAANVPETQPTFTPSFNNNDDVVGEFGPPVTLDPSSAHVKMIHVSPEEVPEKRERKRKQASKKPIESLGSEFDSVEFPISSKIHRLEKEGKKISPPRALSAVPTDEEKFDHQNFLHIFSKESTQAPGITTKEYQTTTTEMDRIFGKLVDETSTTAERTSETISVTVNPSFVSPPPDLQENGYTSTTKKPAHVVLPSKFAQTLPLDRNVVEQFEETNTETTPALTPYEEHVSGIWYPMRKGDIPHLGIFGGELRRAPVKVEKPEKNKRLYTEYTQSNRRGKPVRVEMNKAKKHVRDECQGDKDCGPRMICCKKRWCDRSDDCGVSKFCLPSCEQTKLTFLPSFQRAEGIIDIVYD